MLDIIVAQLRSARESGTVKNILQNKNGKSKNIVYFGA